MNFQLSTPLGTGHAIALPEPPGCPVKAAASPRRSQAAGTSSPRHSRRAADGLTGPRDGPLRHQGRCLRPIHLAFMSVRARLQTPWLALIARHRQAPPLEGTCGMRLQPRSSESSRTDSRVAIDAVEPSATWLEPDPRVERLPSGLAGQVRRIGARARLEGELRSIAVDLLGPNEADEFPASCANWVATATDSAVSNVCDSTLEALVQALDSFLVGIPPDVARQLDRARVRHESGFV